MTKMEIEQWYLEHEMEPYPKDNFSYTTTTSNDNFIEFRALLSELYAPIFGQTHYLSEDMMISQIDGEEASLISMDYLNMLEMISPHITAIELDIVEMHLFGDTFHNIGKKYNRQRAWAHRKYWTAINKLREAFREKM